MSLYYDLHSHSTASDGTLTPTDLVRRAHEKGVQVLALTDHDTTAGFDEARSEADRVGLRLICGAEISVSWGSHEVHVVGLGLDPQCGELRLGLEAAQKFRAWRAEEMGRRLAKRRIEAAFDGARALAPGALVTRSHFARFLLAEGHVKTMQEAFDKYIGRGKPGFVPGKWAELEQAVGWIRDAGGRAVLAHPARYKLTATKLRELIGAFKECGGAALEVVSGSHSRDETFTMANHARKFGLLASRGSDYHGPENPWIDLGALPELPRDLTPVWADWPEVA
ncbi:PHP domain-containing protein [Endothiovibrio diazotrophicus]